MTSRWEKRSAEEKARIKAQQEQIASKPKKYEFDTDRTNKKAQDIYDKGEIPIMCLKCNWSGSDKYVLKKYDNPLFGKQDMIVGRCRTCGGELKRVLMLNMDTMIIEAMIIQNLILQKRITDLRKVN